MKIMARFRKYPKIIVFALLIGVALTGYNFLSYTVASSPGLSGTLIEKQLVWQEQLRHYLVYKPANLTQHSFVVFVLHGSRGTSEIARQQYSYRFDQLADQYGFMVVYPEGFENHWNDCRKVGDFSAKTLDIDDVGFLNTVKQQLVEIFNIDPEQAFITGMSNGGQMVIRMALESPDTFLGYAPVIANLPADENTQCQPQQQAVSFALMNGTSDPLNPYQGGEVALWGVFSKRGQVLSTDKTIAYWRNLAGLSTTPDNQWLVDDTNPHDNSQITVQDWQQTGKPRIRLYKVQGGGHNLPSTSGRMPKILGPQNADTNAADLLWDFFTSIPSDQKGTSAR
jgi:polyhydroxybutyrate depolymerase